ncbi:hypothetical protein [Holdemania massiliensis]|uniref:Uncharacterized protein n=1 Tax=Holdemania massiliensis TaxID=1468449 RepID=A0A6N7SC45_9FIRM|nr:hypothetical protein [Holdemania massiliensis]MSA72600.1 hypothetical protein [Holdemania massiliensis]MSA90876.1 hypothetical protein [Holdemania massiliensis]MSB79686.1 hypothetical protein [Holdemania massiliensis]MSC34607.1 hypothetical protein [Holdemania massiliensis]MSC40996.1 hypothetical protein [Holdemania massiliensis]
MEKHGCGCAFFCAVSASHSEKQSVSSASGATFKMEKDFCPLSAENTPNKPKNRAREGKNQFHPFDCNFMDCVGL